MNLLGKSDQDEIGLILIKNLNESIVYGRTDSINKLSMFLKEVPAAAK